MQRACSPLVLALVVTLANAAKPVVVDDTAYLAFARHIAQNPGDPYGFEVFWYTVPNPAMEILAPPVLPYWLALGIRLFGEHPAVLKLTLLPFVWVFAWAVRELLRRFARGAEDRWLPLVVLSPAVLPTVNLMLDVPALGLGFAALVLFVRAVDAGSWRLALAAGLLAALAMQTKYTALLVPPAMAWYALTHRRVGLGVVTVVVAVAGFASWEGLLDAKYGQSHFLFHARGQQPTAGNAEGPLAALLREKALLGRPLVGYLGCLGIGITLAAGAALGLSRRVVMACAGAWALGFALIALLPGHLTERAVEPFWSLFGFLMLGGLAASAGLLLVRRRKGLAVRRNADAIFLVGWVLLEVAGYFALTPFGAARRVIGLVVIGAVLVARVESRTRRVRAERRLPRWVLGFGISAGVAVAGIDTLDAFPEKVCAERAAMVAADRSPTATVWFAGHWGFQFYCERVGMKPVVPGRSVLAPGDVLVLPVYPDEHGFYRPHIGTVRIAPPPWAVEPIAEVVADDALSATTLPSLYGGGVPMTGRDHPRLRVVVSRVKATWAVPGR